MLSKNKKILKLLKHYKQISLLGKVSAVLGWDLNVNLPPKASVGRSQQAAYLAELGTKLWKNEEFKKGIEEFKVNDPQLTPEEKAIIRNLQHGLKFYTKIPEALIVEREKVTSQAFMAWQKAKIENKYTDFAPFLKKIVELSQRMAKHLEYQQNPYDALLDLFEPGLTAADCKKMFNATKPSLTQLIQRVQKSKGYNPVNPLAEGKIQYSIPDQKKLAHFIMQRMGYDMQAGRLDISAHPFTTTLADRNDIRITTNFKENDFREAFTATVHETGHGLYEQNVNPDYDDSPLSGGVSLGIHEAMSRFYENQIGKHPQFLEFMTPLFQAFFPEQLQETTPEVITKLFNTVKPSFIRIEADEVTYSLHIVLRFEMEDDLINGRIKVEDAPEVWNEKMKKYFGIAPKTDTEGVLQDVHWSYGSIGYFPAYALGNLYGSQLFAKMKKEISVDEELRHGNLGVITSWLKENVYKHGSMLWPKEVIKNATKKDLDSQYFIDYLEEKYSKIYKLK